MKKVLLVDDEVQILKALIRVFIDCEYDVFTAENGKDALEILEHQEVDLIISDMRMPDIDGYELLSRVKELYPNIIRIILSGFSDERIIYDAIQKKIAKIYMFKPWENEKLVNQVAKLLEVAEFLKRENIFTNINSIDELPTITNNYQNIMDLINSGSDLNLISEKIKTDISILAKLLHISNAVFYGERINSLEQVVSYIGIEHIKNLITSTSLIDTNGCISTEVELIENIWRHSDISNKLLVFLYEKHLNIKIPKKYASVAILHNIGQIYFLKFYYRQYLDILVKTQNEKKNLISLEKEAFLISHVEIGSYLLQWWGFPQEVVEATLFHHNPIDSKMENNEIVCAVHIAINYASKMLGIEGLEPFDERTFDILNISKNNFEKSLELFKL